MYRLGYLYCEAPSLQGGDVRREGERHMGNMVTIQVTLLYSLGPWPSLVPQHILDLGREKNRENTNVGSNAQTLTEVFREPSSSLPGNRTLAAVGRAPAVAG